jgi:hypothetical protein
MVLSGDPLTGLPGREHVEHRLREEQHRADRYGRAFSVLTFVLQAPDGGHAVPAPVQRTAARALAREKLEALFPAGSVLGYPFQIFSWSRDVGESSGPVDISSVLRSAA